jgi:hypothetical protein
MWGRLKTATYSAQNENEGKTRQRNIDVCQTIRTVPELLRFCDSPLLYVCIGALMLVEDILCIFCEFLLDKQ